MLQIQPVSSWKNPNNHLHELLTSSWYKIIYNLLAQIIVGTHDFYKSRNIQPALFPISTGSVSSPMGRGSDSLPVQIEIKGNKVYLADSMQFSLELGARLSKNGAYYIMPTFRGENLDDRHLNEFFHIEAELPNTTLAELGLHIREYILYLLNHIHTQCGQDIFSVTGNLEHIDKILTHPEKAFQTIRYEEAVTFLKNTPHALSYCETGFKNITSVGERALIQRHGEFTWLTHMPWENVPFYQAAEPGTAYSMTMDLLAGIGEIAGCGQRVYSSDDLKASLAKHHVSISGYEWYSEMRDIHPLQTSGFGLGIERLILWLTKTNDIRDCMLLIRDHERICLP